jgi:hypothetical protein
MKVAVVHGERRTRYTSRAAAAKAAKACSREHRGEWCDVVVNGRRVTQCLNGRCKKS